jgi:predicted small lipoprotein YifL
MGPGQCDPQGARAAAAMKLQCAAKLAAFALNFVLTMNPSILIIALLLAGCGQTGALYLPDHSAPGHGSGSPQTVAATVPGSTPTVVNVTSSQLRNRLPQTAIPSITTIPAQPVPAGGIGSPLAPPGP